MANDFEKTRIVIVGATSAIAEHCARQWLAQGAAHLFLVGRDLHRLEAISRDLMVRSPQSQVECCVLAFDEPGAIEQWASAVCGRGTLDIVLIAHGDLPVQADCQVDLARMHRALQVNAVSPVMFAEAFAGHMERAGRGTLGIIGSVAGDRGRKSNYVYGAAKGLVERYAQGLQHRLAKTGVKVVLVKPGPTDTPMTAHLKAKGASLASVDAVARRIVIGMARGKPIVYAPPRWAVIMWVLRTLPASVFNRLDI